MSTAVILAGGASERMGFDKQKLVFNREPIIQHHIKLLEPYFDEILIISNNHLSDIFLNKNKVYIHEDILKNYGPLGGIHAALTYAKSDLIFVVACDMPHINIDYLLYEKACLTHQDALVTSYGDWIEPFHGFYNKSLIKPIEKYLLKGRRNISGLLSYHKVTYIDENIARKYSEDWSLFDNINTKEDLMLNGKNKKA